jgi:hypothetical protein
VSVVYPNNGSDPLLVSTPFLETSLSSTSNDDVRLKDLQMYEQMTNRVAEQFSEQMFPDASAGDANVQRQVIQGQDRDMIIEQDPKAGPYARVTITDKDGNVISEASVSANMASKILENPSADADRKIDSLQKSQFTLPEEARANFDGLTKQQLLAIVAKKPELQKQDFIKMTGVFAAEKAKKEAAAAAGRPDEMTTESSRMTASANPDARSKAARRNSEVPKANSPDKSESRASQSRTAADVSEPTAVERFNSWNVPTIIGAVLGIGAVGVFLYGLMKTRRG